MNKTELKLFGNLPATKELKNFLKNEDAIDKVRKSIVEEYRKVKEEFKKKMDLLEENSDFRKKHDEYVGVMRELSDAQARHTHLLDELNKLENQYTELERVEREKYTDEFAKISEKEVEIQFRFEQMRKMIVKERNKIESKKFQEEFASAVKEILIGGGDDE
jgi:hypothetical protein